MSEPQSLEEFSRRFAVRQKITGFGMEVTCHCPCPFCAAIDWMVHEILDTDKAMRTETTCKECSRSGKFIFSIDEPGRKQFEFVQTGGPPPPDWLVPKPRYDPKA
jgi:hypothetical protein